MFLGIKILKRAICPLVPLPPSYTYVEENEIEIND